MMTTEKNKQSYQSPSLKEMRLEIDSCILQSSTPGFSAPDYNEVKEENFWSNL
jgi:hypothetical protein